MWSLFSSEKICLSIVVLIKFFFRYFVLFLTRLEIILFCPNWPCFSVISFARIINYKFWLWKNQIKNFLAQKVYMFSHQKKDFHHHICSYNLHKKFLYINIYYLAKVQSAYLLSFFYTINSFKVHLAHLKKIQNAFCLIKIYGLFEKIFHIFLSW